MLHLHSRECSDLCLSSETGDEAHLQRYPAAWLGRGCPPGQHWFSPRGDKSWKHTPPLTVSPCWCLKNAPARVEESRCSPQCCSRMVKILPGVLTSSAPMDSTSCLARPSSAPRSQAAATGSTMGPSSRNNFASLTKSSASPSSPENWRSLWGLKLCSIGGAGGWTGLFLCSWLKLVSAVVFVKTGLKSVAAPLILVSQCQSCNGVEWSKC